LRPTTSIDRAILYRYAEVFTIIQAVARPVGFGYPQGLTQGSLELVAVRTLGARVSGVLAKYKIETTTRLAYENRLQNASGLKGAGSGFEAETLRLDSYAP